MASRRDSRLALRVSAAREGRPIEIAVRVLIAMADPQRSSLVLSELKTLGVHLSIDDFGTGYSSLSRLQGFPVDTLKIDRTFVSKMDTDGETGEIVRIIMMLANNLGLKVVAEGAETAEQVRLLKQLKCELAQGYFFARRGDHAAAQALLMGTHTVEAGPLPTAASGCD